jgi:hypothetical protein
MSDKKQYYKLDDIGFVGTQEKIPNYKRKVTEEKTAEIFQAYREKSARRSKTTSRERKKAS